jgi:flagellar motor switch protein FliG
MATTPQTSLVRSPERPGVSPASVREKGGEAGLAGPFKAALWLLSADEELAVQTLGLLAAGEVRRLKEAVERLGRASQEQLMEVHQDFQRNLQQSPFQVRGSVDYLGRLAARAFGESKANELLAALPPQATTKVPGLDRADIDSLATLLGSEHPQVVAAVLATLEPGRAAQLLKRLQLDLRKDVLERVAKLSQMPRTGLVDVERILGAGLTMTDDADGAIDGVRTAAVLLNQLPPAEADEILEALKRSQEATAGAIRHAMFTFEDLAQLDRRGWQALLKEVQRDQLLPALKTASPEIRDKVFASLSKRAGEMLKDDLDVLAPLRLADVEAARQAVVDVALRMRSEGRLAVGGQGGEELV